MRVAFRGRGSPGLFLIAESTTPAVMLDAWHADPYEQFDFARGAERLEVKTCSSFPRKHHFNLAQLRPAGSITVFVASLIARRSTAGLNLYELLDKVRRLAVTPEHRAKLELLAADVMTEDNDIGDVRFDPAEARETLRFFRAEDIPSVPANLPDPVANVHFDSSVSETAAVAEVPSESFLLAAAWSAVR